MIGAPPAGFLDVLDGLAAAALDPTGPEAEAIRSWGVTSAEAGEGLGRLAGALAEATS